ncbi:uncharacterized protein KGF55_001752 [Candida pseudojiufengensis]|uniref:uncharacterized protein n=1 Tax=Candida pseudojiufengensis TaxID=497109 RepID=UPI0022242C75|nr:uncharacterized protein KGF55_001752 [Candida pseudojiufengensis]KAI5964683.1 hypothetical protein KGF55_001752 [Candida pseudojiufengensis]
MNINSPFICCGVCYKGHLDLKQVNEQLCLTSCAHITYHSLNNSSGIDSCPICHSENISTIVIDQSIPSDLNHFFTPVTQQLNNFSNSCQHQFNTLINKVEHLTQLNNKLNDKIKKQKEFLYAAKEEITHLNKYKSQVEDLKLEIKELNNKLDDCKRPETFDLSNVNEIEFGRNIEHLEPIDDEYDNSFLRPETYKSANTKPFNFASNTFISKINQESNNQSKKVLDSNQLHQSSTERARKYTSNQMNKKVVADVGGNHGNVNKNSTLKRSFFAESTNIGEFNNPNRRPSIFSAGTTSITSSRSGFQKLNSNKYGKASRRSATSQLASRLTANMRIGSLNGDKVKLKNNMIHGIQAASYRSNMIDKGPVLNKVLNPLASKTSHPFR